MLRQRLLRVADPLSGPRLCEPQQRRTIHAHGILHSPIALPTLLRVIDPRAGPRLCEPQHRQKWHGPGYGHREPWQ